MQRKQDNQVRRMQGFRHQPIRCIYSCLSQSALLTQPEQIRLTHHFATLRTKPFHLRFRFQSSASVLQAHPPSAQPIFFQILSIMSTPSTNGPIGNRYFTYNRFGGSASSPNGGGQSKNIGDTRLSKPRKSVSVVEHKSNDLISAQYQSNNCTNAHKGRW